MTIQPRNSEEFGCAAVMEPPVAAQPTVKRRLHLYPLREELSLMDTVIPLTVVPELDDSAEDDREALTGLNLFGAANDLCDGSEPTNILRETRLTRAGQGRVLALRRRAMQARLRRPMPAWPLPGGQSTDELRQMREILYSPCEELDAAAEKPSVPLRLATHAIGLSLVATALPVGAAMMTYNVLKGEDMKMTARLTTLTGLALAILAGNPQLAQLIGA